MACTPIFSSTTKGKKRLTACRISVVIRFGFSERFSFFTSRMEKRVQVPYAGLVPIAKLKIFAVTQHFMKCRVTSSSHQTEKPLSTAESLFP
jgi:hypothetical protein